MPQAIVWKSIKPGKLKDAEMRRILRNAMRVAARRIRKDFEATTKTWEHEVKFTESTHLSQSDPDQYVVVGTDDEIYRYVNNGTRPHEIWAGAYTGKSDKKTLAFPTMFSPKTSPRVIGSTPGARGGPMAFAPMVHHPGTEAREFDKVIEEKRTPWFKTLMEDAMREAARASGHGK